MANGKSTWKYNKLLTARRNYFLPGGSLTGGPSMRSRVLPIMGFVNTDDPSQGMTKNESLAKTAFNPEVGTTLSNFEFEVKRPEKAPEPPKEEAPKDPPPEDPPEETEGNGTPWGSIAGLAGQAISDIAGIFNAKKQIKENGNRLVAEAKAKTIGTQSFNDTLDSLTEDWKNLSPIGNVTDKKLGYSGAGAIAGSSAMAGARGAAAGAGLGPWGIVGGFLGGATSGILKGLVGNKEAKKQAQRVNEAIADVNSFNDRSLMNRGNNLIADQMNNLKANYASFGGELNIKGADWTNGLLQVNAGGSHEMNPYEGVPMGVDQEGVPNLVEEGETVFNDYVYSKRLKVPKAVGRKYRLGGKKGVTFADASKKLAKESEERPNDPISQRGLEAFMADLAQAQEDLKTKEQLQQPMENYAALGGNLFGHGGKESKKSSKKSSSKSTSPGNQPLDYNNRTPGLFFGLDPKQFNPYNSDGTINFNIMHGADSPYMKRRQFVLDNWDTPGVQAWLDKYVEGINNYNKDRAGYKKMTKADITRDIFEKRTIDGNWGGMYEGINYAGDPYEVEYQHKLIGEDGTLSDLPEEKWYYPNTNFETGKDWNTQFGKEIKRENNGLFTEQLDPETNKMVRRYFYSPVKDPKKDPEAIYYYNKGTRKNPNYVKYEGEDPAELWMSNNKYGFTKEGKEGDSPTYFFDRDEEMTNTYADKARFAPIFGSLVSVGLDAAGLTEPDYSNADALSNFAARSTGQFQPVKFNPIGNYLTYRPFDQQYAVNNLNAQAAGTRRALAQNAGLNRGMGAGSILAADYNAQNQLGELQAQAFQYNEELKKGIEDFNRNTNITNAEGMLKADTSNQENRMKGWEANANLAYQAAQMRQNIKNASDASKSANFSGLFTNLGNLGNDEYTRWQQDWGLSKGLWGIGAEDYARYLSWKQTKGAQNNNPNRPTSNNPLEGRETRQVAKGGKIKRRKKGLTF